MAALCSFTTLAFSSCNRVYEEGEQEVSTATIVNRAAPIYMATSVRVNPPSKFGVGSGSSGKLREAIARAGF